ncbi:MAG: protease, partial [Lachnospiraceae bacterium]
MKAKLSYFFSAMLGVIIGAGITLSAVLPQANRMNLTNTSNNEINQTKTQQLSTTLNS